MQRTAPARATECPVDLGDARAGSTWMKRSRLAVFVAAFGVVAAACGNPVPEPWTVAGARDKDWARAEAIREMYRQGSERYGYGLDLCVELDGEASASRVFRRLELRGVRRWSSRRCAVRGLTVVEAISGREAIEAIVTSAELIEPGRVRVQAGFARGPLAGEGRELLLDFSFGRWSVTSSTSTWVS